MFSYVQLVWSRMPENANGLQSPKENVFHTMVFFMCCILNLFYFLFSCCNCQCSVWKESSSGVLPFQVEVYSNKGSGTMTMSDLSSLSCSHPSVNYLSIYKYLSKYLQYILSISKYLSLKYIYPSIYI